MFLKYPITCSHVYCYSNKSLPLPPERWCQFFILHELLVYKDVNFMMIYARRLGFQWRVQPQTLPITGDFLNSRCWTSKMDKNHFFNFFYIYLFDKFDL